MLPRWRDGDAITEKPDVVYLHPDYTSMNREIRFEPRFAASYLAAPPTVPPAQLSVFLRRDSRYWRRLVRAIDEERSPLAP